MGTIIAIIGGGLIGWGMYALLGTPGIILAMPLCFLWGVFSAKLFSNRSY